MLMKYLFTLLLVLFITSTSYAQSVNDYKYVIVPEKFDFLKSQDQYQVNSLTKFLFNKYGFDAYIRGDEMPFSARSQGCDVLYAEIESESNFVQARLVVVLKDCKGEVIFKTSQGKSKNKEYKRAYHEALREAFFDIEALAYSYNGTVMKSTIENEIDVTKVIKAELDIVAKPSVIKMDASEVKSASQIANTEATIERVPAREIYTSEDGFYSAEKDDRVLTFKEGSKTIGVTTIDLEKAFPVTTSEFSGEAFFLEGRLVVQRKIKGVAGKVEMIFTKE